MTRTISRVLLLLMIAFLGCACAQQQVATRKNEMTEVMNGLLGKPKDQIVLALGAPIDVQSVGGIEILKYHWSYGTRSQAVAAPSDTLVTAHARSWESYDTVTAYFQNGVMVKWDGYVQR